MSDYTPTTGQVERAWVSHRLNPDYFGSENFGRGSAIAAEFDRWLNDVRADTWKQGAMAAIGRSVPPSMILDGNPYRFHA